MSVFRTKRWPPLAVGSLKWCCILVGMIAGAYLSEFTRDHVWILAAAAAALAVYPTVTYFGRD